MKLLLALTEVSPESRQKRSLVDHQKKHAIGQNSFKESENVSYP